MSFSHSSHPWSTLCVQKQSQYYGHKQGIFIWVMGELFFLRKWNPNKTFARSRRCLLSRSLDSWIQRQTHNLWFILTLFHPSNTGEIGRRYCFCYAEQQNIEINTQLFCVCILLSSRKMNGREKVKMLLLSAFCGCFMFQKSYINLRVTPS